MRFDEGPSAPQALSQPFRLRGYSGRVDVQYEANRDPRRTGFDLLDLPFDLALTLGYPTIRATVAYDGPGYRAYMGWIQLISNHDPMTGVSTTSVDLLPIHENVDSPFATFGVAPTLFDAPANPDHETEDWIADTFLTFCPNIARTRTVAALLGFRWGYTLRDRHASPLPLTASDAAAWDECMPTLRRQFPTWEFLPSLSADA